MTEPSYKIKTNAPSNIALIKYWGKFGDQLPINPSLSMTLNRANTTTELEIYRNERDQNKIQVELFLDDELNISFSERILSYIKKLSKDYPALLDKKYIIKTSNSFPHSSGVASSASGFAALALGIWKYLESLGIKDLESVSSLARRGSGSAARSFDGPYISWGSHSLIESQLEQVHSELSLCDSIILVEKAQKKISSSLGHNLMTEHHFKEARIKKAKYRFDLALKYLMANSWNDLGEIIEQEALELHALMMTSSKSFWLMTPKTLEVMNWVRDYREQTHKVPVFFTLDAGANVHCLYPREFSNRFKKDFTLSFPELDVLHDEQGLGANVVE